MEVIIATVGTTLIPFIEWCGDKELKEFTPDYINDHLNFIHAYTYIKAGKGTKYYPLDLTFFYIICKQLNI